MEPKMANVNRFHYSNTSITITATTTTTTTTTYNNNNNNNNNEDGLIGSPKRRQEIPIYAA